MTLTWFGTAGLLLQKNNDTIAFDPFSGIGIGDLSHPPSALPHEQTFRSARHVFVTHGHFDHIYHIPRLYAHTQTIIHCTAAPAHTLLEHGFPAEQLDIITPGQTLSACAFRITAYPSRHCHFDRGILKETLLDRRVISHPVHTAELFWLHEHCPEKRQTLLYEVTDGSTRVQIMGSMALADGVSYSRQADLLVLPLQGRSDQDHYALELVRRLQPRAILLDHFDDTFPPLTHAVDLSGFLRNVKREFGIPCLVPEVGKSITTDKIA